jgi:lipopolysaccharide export system permease protein
MSMQELLHPNPALVPERDFGKLLVEANRRLTQPLTTVGFAAVALFFVLTGSFRRAGNVLRPLASVLTMVGLLALGLSAQSLATRHPVLIPIIWIQALLPGLVAAWLLFVPTLSVRPRMRVLRRVA